MKKPVKNIKLEGGPLPITKYADYIEKTMKNKSKDMIRGRRELANNLKEIEAKRLRRQKYEVRAKRNEEKKAL